MPRFELKISWPSDFAVLAALLLAVVSAGLVWNGSRLCNSPPPVAAPAVDFAAAVPEFVSGLPSDFREKREEAFEAYPEPFRVGAVRGDLRQKSAFLWEAVLQVESPRKPKGQHYTAGPQLTGSCVAWGGSTALYYTGANAVIAGNASAIDDPCQPVQYGITRVTQGGGRPRCGQQGAYPSDFVKGVKNYGWATWSECPLAYTGAMEDRLGCSGPTREQLAFAKSRAGVDSYPIRSLDELLEALHNGYAGTAGIDWSPGRTRNDNGRIVTDFNGLNRGGHQIAWVGWDGERQHLIFHNSHGVNAHPRNDGDPPGSFRVTRSTAEWMLQTGEFWALSSIPGFPPQEIDLTPLRPKKRSAAQTKEFSLVDPDRTWNVLWNWTGSLPRLFDAGGRCLPDARHLCQLRGCGCGPLGAVCQSAGCCCGCRCRSVGPVRLETVGGLAGNRPAGHAAIATAGSGRPVGPEGNRKQAPGCPAVVPLA